MWRLGDPRTEITNTKFQSTDWIWCKILKTRHVCHSKHVSRSTPSAKRYGIQCKAVALLKMTQRQRGWILNSEYAFTLLNSLQRLRPKYLFWMESQGDGIKFCTAETLFKNYLNSIELKAMSGWAVSFNTGDHVYAILFTIFMSEPY